MASTGLTDGDLPGFWVDADRASLAGQRWTLLYARLRLGGSILAALGAVLDWHAGRVDIAAVLILTGFTVALCAEIATWVHQPERDWYGGRALAESAKTLAWRYAVGADPFPTSMSRADGERVLNERMSKISQEIVDRITIDSSVPVVTPGMQSLRLQSFEERRAAYIGGRTEGQRDWYSRKARENRRRSTVWRTAMVIVEVIALVLAAMRVFGGWHVDLAGLLGALIAVGVAWMAIKQYNTLASAYSVAANELTIQINNLQSVPESDWAQFVADAEEAISREHTTWVASRTGRLPASPT